MSIGYKKFQDHPEKKQMSDRILTFAREVQKEGWGIYTAISKTSKHVNLGTRIVESVIRQDLELVEKFKADRKARSESRQKFWIGVDRGLN